MFNNLQITAKGTQLLAENLNGDTLEFTKIKLGSGTGAVNITTIADLVTTKITLLIERNTVIDTKTINIGANLKQKNITETFRWSELGIFAKNKTKNTAEVLFSYQQISDGVQIEKNGAINEMLLDFLVTINNSANINITLNASLVFPTKAEVDEVLNAKATELNNKILGNTTHINNHKGDKNNPHNVTKAQVGLDAVENYPIATEPEAKAGTINNKYMTPKLTKESIKANSIETSGNIILKVQPTQPATESGKTIIWINTNS